MARASRNTEFDIPTYEDIARKAYELYIERGGAPGREVDDWLEAERQLVTIDVIETIETVAVVGIPAEAGEAVAPRAATNGATSKPAARRTRTTKAPAATNGSSSHAEPKPARRTTAKTRANGKT